MALEQNSTNESCNEMPPLPAALDKPIRLDLVETAVKFLQDAKVKSAPLSKRTAFLESKGLSAEEINTALLKADIQESIKTDTANINKSSKMTDKADGGLKGLLLTTAVIIGTGSLIISNYQNIKSMASDFISSFINSNNDRIDKVERELKDSIEELKRSMEEKERKIQEILMEIKNQNN